MMIQTIISIFLMFLDVNPDVPARTELNEKFNQYWYRGEAEITSFKLEQARYGSMHEGTATLVFVTEDFSKSKQVKLDYASRNSGDVSKIIKLNFVKKFVTGIYPYSMMSSVFTPVDRMNEKHTLKVSTTSQEWCGHTFLQLNHRKGKYEMHGYSYFESEGDEKESLKDALLEDEIWNLIRINPELLPEGNIEIIPGTFYSRLKHVPLKVIKAKTTKSVFSENSALMEYEIEYGKSHSLKIFYEKDFPHRIQGWEERLGDGLTTRATKMGELKSAYWRQNRPEDLGLRDKLGL